MTARKEKVLALAGVFQAAALVHRIAWHGQETHSAVDASLNSLFTFDAEDTLAVFGGVAGVRIGMQAVIDHLSGEAAPDEAPVMRYAIGLLHLERRADAHGGVWIALHDGLTQAQRQLEAFGLQHENTIAALAGLYADHISPMGPRIMVEGETIHLRDTRTAALIRALLLAGIRSAVLWRQLGASRWSLLLGRRGMIADAEAWLV